MRRQVQESGVHHARRRVTDFRRAGRLPGDCIPKDERTWRYAMNDPDDVQVVCAGAEGRS